MDIRACFSAEYAMKEEAIEPKSVPNPKLDR
jgi:hypothetical protein